MLRELQMGLANAFLAVAAAIPAPEIAEISGLSLSPTGGGGSAWILGAHFSAHATGSDVYGTDTCISLIPHSTGGAGPSNVEVPLRIDLLLESGEGAIVDLPNPFPPGLWRVQVRSAAGAALSSVMNGPEPQWVSPFAAPGATVSILGRRFWSGGTVALVPVSSSAGNVGTRASPVMIPVASPRSESEVEFTLPTSLPPQNYTVWWNANEEWWGKNTTESTATQLVIEVSRRNKHNGIVINLCPGGPGSLSCQYNPVHHAIDGTAVLEAAIRNATLNGTSPGGRVLLGPGVINLNPPHEAPGTLRYNHSCAICGFGPGFAVTLVGAGRDATTLRIGPLVSQGFWGSAVSLEDLTLTDYLERPGIENVTGENQVNGVPLAYQRALWSQDTCSWWGQAWLNETRKPQCTDPWASRQFAMTDISFHRVSFDMNRVDHTLSVRYVNRLRVDDCLFIGGGVFIAGPTRDVRLER